MSQSNHHQHDTAGQSTATDSAHHNGHQERPIEQHSHHSDHSSHKHHGHGAHAGHEGHDKHAGHSPGMFKQRFFVSLLLTLPILYFSTQLQTWLGYQAVAFPGSNWINPVLGVALYFYGGWPFLKAMARIPQPNCHDDADCPGNYGRLYLQSGGVARA